MNKSKSRSGVDKHYVSEIDQRLAEFNRSQPKSASQQAEIAKYAQIERFRDDPKAHAEEDQDSSDLFR